MDDKIVFVLSETPSGVVNQIEAIGRKPLAPNSISGEVIGRKLNQVATSSTFIDKY